MSEAAEGAVRMGRWEIASVPAGWWFVPDFGLKQQVTAGFASNVTVKDDVLLAGDKLALYIDAQIEILKGRFDNPVFAGPQKSGLFPADETMLLMIRHQPLQGATVLQVQTYVRLGAWLGIITLTTLEQMLASVRKDYEQFVGSLTVAPEEMAAETPGGSA